MERKNPSILIVDDISQNIQLVASVLKSENYQISFALDSKSALIHLENKLFDLVLLDVMMPEVNGFDLCKIIKSNERMANTPVIFITAKTDITSVTKGFEVGGVDYITKPFNNAELLSRVQTHLRLKISEDNLREANKLKDSFLSIIAHDLKNPLSQILGFIELLLKNHLIYTPEKREYFLKVMQEAALHNKDLINNLLIWARTQTGQIVPKVSMFNIQEVVDEVIKVHQTQINKKNIIIFSSFSRPIWGEADKNMIATVLRNLLSNAIKFTPTDGMIRIEYEIIENKILIHVIDNGIGITEEKLPHIFNLKSEKTPEGIKTNTGLGLVLTKEFVTKNGGEIFVKSSKESGTTFSFTIPTPLLQ